MAVEQGTSPRDLLARQIELARQRQMEQALPAPQPAAPEPAPQPDYQSVKALITQNQQANPAQPQSPADKLRQVLERARQNQAPPAAIEGAAPAPPAAEPAQPPAPAMDKFKQMLEQARASRPKPEPAKPKGAREPKIPEPPGRGLVTRPVDPANPPRPPDSEEFAPETPVGVRSLEVVSQESGKPLFAATGDTYAQRALLWAAGFKYGPVEFQPPLRKKGERQKGWSKRDLWYTDDPEVKARLEGALADPSDPLNTAAAVRQEFLEQRDEERRRLRDEAQARADAAPDDHYSQEGYSVDEHIRSYSDRPKNPVNIPLPPGLQLEPYQQAAVEFIQEKFDPSRSQQERGAMLADIPGLGKALAHDTPVLTPSGWTAIGELRVGDVVLAGDGTRTRVTGVYPQGVKDVYRVAFTDGASTECCEEHLWLVNTRHRKRAGRPWKLRQLRDIVREGLVDAHGGKRHYIPVAGRVDLDSSPTAIHPYVLGALLGDGGMKSHNVFITSEDEELLERISNLLPPGLHLRPTGHGCDYAVTTGVNGARNPLIGALRDMGLMSRGSDDKFVPHKYMFNSEEARLELLRGLMDTDGTQTGGVTQFSSNSKELADSVRFLVNSLGGIARQTKKTSASGKTHHIVTICMPDDKCPFWLSRKANRWRPRSKYRPARAFESVEFSREAECVCISVEHESRTFITSDFIVTHNTMPAIGVINGDPGIKQVLIVCPAVMRKTWLDELTKWLAGPERRNPDGTLKTRVRVVWGKEWPQDGDIFIINYENLPQHEQHLQGTHWDYVVMDESHRLKNEKGLRATTILGGFDKKGNQHGGIVADRRLLLTGTPIPRTTWELYANLRFLRPDVYNNAQEFVDTFAKQRVILRTWAEKQADGSFEQRQSFRRVPTAPKNIELLNMILFGGGTRQGSDGSSRFDGVAMRRLRSDLGPEHQLPPLREKFHLVGRGHEDPDLHSHDEELHKLLDEVEHAETLDDRAEAEMRFEAAARASFDEVTKKRKEAGAAKVDYAVKMAVGIAMHDEINPQPGGKPSKVIVFAYHHDVVHDIAEKLRAACKAMGKPWTVAVTYGKTPAAERDRKFADVREDRNTRFLVASYPVLREGITLTAVDHVIHAELSPNPVDHEQATARAWRKGQERPVTSHYIVRRGTIDERLMEILREKNTAVQQALNFRY